jgi:hypothetical protein
MDSLAHKRFREVPPGRLRAEFVHPGCTNIGLPLWSESGLSDDEDRQHFVCATWLHKAREMPKEQFRREVVLRWRYCRTVADATRSPKHRVSINQVLRDSTVFLDFGCDAREVLRQEDSFT